MGKFVRYYMRLETQGGNTSNEKETSNKMRNHKSSNSKSTPPTTRHIPKARLLEITRLDIVPRAQRRGQRAGQRGVVRQRDDLERGGEGGEGRLEVVAVEVELVLKSLEPCIA